METLRRMLHAAREALGLSQQQVAEAAKVSARTIRRMESGEGEIAFQTLEAAKDFLETHGVEFLEPRDPNDWALAFDGAHAPHPELVGARKRLFDPPPGKVLRAARVVLAVSQNQLAEQAGVAHTTIRRLEHSATDVSPELAFRLQSYLQTRGIEIRKPDAELGWRIYMRQRRDQ